MIIQTMKSAKEEMYKSQVQIRGLTDDKLMDLHLMLIDSKVSKKVKGDNNDPLHSIAVCGEVKKRRVKSSLFWRRWLDRNKYRKWQIHSQLAEIISAQSMIEMLEQDLEC